MLADVDDTILSFRSLHCDLAGWTGLRWFGLRELVHRQANTNNRHMVQLRMFT